MSQTKIAYVTVVPGSTAVTLLSVCAEMQSVPGVGVGVLVEVGEVLGVGVGVLIGPLNVPPGTGLVVALPAGSGCGSPPGEGEAEVPGLGWGSGGVLVLVPGLVLGSGGLLWPTTSARRTGMPAGCCARAPVRAAGRVSAFVVAVAVGLDVDEVVHGFVLAACCPRMPVRNMLTAP